MISSEEEKAVQDLWSLIGEGIPQVARITRNGFGIVFSDDHVTSLALYNKKLPYLPRSFCNSLSLN
jgi:hypothetical protein